MFPPEKDTGGLSGTPVSRQRKSGNRTACKTARRIFLKFDPGQGFVDVVLSEGGDHDGLDGMQAVFRLVEGSVAGRLEDLVVHFHAVDAVFLVNLLADDCLWTRFAATWPS